MFTYFYTCRYCGDLYSTIKVYKGNSPCCAQLQCYKEHMRICAYDYWPRQFPFLAYGTRYEHAYAWKEEDQLRMEQRCIAKQMPLCLPDVIMQIITEYRGNT